jgi:hypothetical protein
MRRSFALLALTLASPAARADDAVAVSLSTTLTSGPIAPTFASFSIEINNALQYFGTAAAPNFPFITLCNVLRNASGGAGPSVRIGGGSADASLWWTAGPPLPPSQTYAITPVDIAAYAAALPLFDGRAVIDTSMFLANNVTWGAAHIAAVARLMGFDRVEGVEIGNEVDSYHDSGERPHAWAEPDYETEFAAHAAALEAAGMPRGRVQGATYCCDNPSYVNAFAGYVARFKGVLASISWHHYALHQNSNATITAEALLSEESTSGAADFLQPLAATAHAAGIPFRVGEGNSVNDGGRANVSDVFAAALFALDVQMATAAAGVDQWNWHGGPGSLYAPISFARRPAPPGPPDVRPLYYGMWAFASASRGGARLVAATVNTSNPLIKVWALQQSPTELTVLVIHKDAAAAAPARVSVAPPPGHAVSAAGGALARLIAPSVLSRYGVTFAGQTFDGSTDGFPVGARVTEPVAVSATGELAFALAPASAALLTFSTD